MQIRAVEGSADRCKQLKTLRGLNGTKDFVACLMCVLALQKYWLFKINTELPPCFLQVYHVSSDSYETQNQHYGRSLTKETVKDGEGISVLEFGALGYFSFYLLIYRTVQEEQFVCSHFKSLFFSSCQMGL